MKMNIRRVLGVLTGFMMVLAAGGIVAAQPGTIDSAEESPSPASTTSLSPFVTETGRISLSLDGMGTLTESGIVQVEKPVNATVRSAYLITASMYRQGPLANGTLSVAASPVSWDVSISSLSWWNHYADVTPVVKPIVDAAPAGRINISLTESPSVKVDGSVLAVIFDDPNVVKDNTVVLLFGGQNTAGDTFNIGLAQPLDLSDPDLALGMSLGISYGYQKYGGDQYSIVDVNGVRLTTSAGGEDDGASSNGALITVGGLDDNSSNPSDPYATPSNPRTDDELYDLLPFVEDGDTSIQVNTSNPSNDDNMFFGAFNLASTSAVVGEGIVLGPSSAQNPLNQPHTVTATVQDDAGAPVVNRTVTFEVILGPNAGAGGTAMTDADGQAMFTYASSVAGVDVIRASFVDSSMEIRYSNKVSKEWVDVLIPEFPTLALPIAAILGLTFLILRRREE